MKLAQAIFAPLLGVAASAWAQTAPFVHTQPTGPISTTNATLNGMVMPNGLPTTAWFEWGGWNAGSLPRRRYESFHRRTHQVEHAFAGFSGDG